MNKLRQLASVLFAAVLLLCAGCETKATRHVYDGHFINGTYTYDQTGSNWYRDAEGQCWYSGDPPNDPAFYKASDDFRLKHGWTSKQIDEEHRKDRGELVSVLVEAKDGVPVPTPAMRVYFAPGNDCENAAVELIGKAEKEIKIRAYNFSSAKIRDAIQAARSRGVSVTAIVDHKALAERKCVAPDLVRAGCAIYDDNNHRIAHSKIIVTDSKCVCFGSYNWTEAAKHNSEVMVIRENDKEFAAEFEKDFEKHLKEAKTTRIK